jgi:hypothetical protein
VFLLGPVGVGDCALHEHSDLPKFPEDEAQTLTHDHKQEPDADQRGKSQRVDRWPGLRYLIHQADNHQDRSAGKESFDDERLPTASLRRSL